MTPHGKELQEELKNLTARLHKEAKEYRKIGGQLKISQKTVAAAIRRYRARTSTFNQSCSGHPLELMARTVGYLHSLALTNRQASASDLTHGLSMEIGVSVLAQCEVHCIKSTTMDDIQGKKKPCLLSTTKLQD